MNARTWVEISRERIAQNFRAIRAAVGERVTVAPVVKANAYGHGAVEVARALETEGARWLAVCCVEEGVELREAGIGCRILVMGGVFPFEREAAFAARLTPVVHSLEELRELDRVASGAAVHFKVDSGMTRLGSRVSIAHLVESMSALRGLRVEGLMSHFASAEDFTSHQSEEQVAAFAQVREALRAAGIAPEIVHFSSTTGIAYARREGWHSLVRPGLSIYGYVPRGSDNAPAPLMNVKPVLTWKARLIAVKDIPEGAQVGYNARFRAPQAMRIGVVAAGYADGIPHRLSCRGHVIAEGRLVPILGAVSMDLTTIDLTGTSLAPGDPITLLGESLDAQSIAETAGEISYSVLCGIGNRVKRVYV